MIVVFGPNLAVDRTLAVEDFHAGQVFRTSTSLVVPGGKGVNVARALRALGEAVHLVGLVAGWSGRFIREGLQQEGIEATLVEVEGISRTCTIVVDPRDGTATVVNEEGDLRLGATQAEAIERLLGDLTAGASALVCSGSLPQALPRDFYRRVLENAGRAGCLTILDTSGAALAEGLAARPHLIKPNEHELADLVRSRPELGQAPAPPLRQPPSRREEGSVRRPGPDRAEQAAAPWVLQAARGLVARGVEVAVVSMGAAGAVAVTRDGAWMARPPRVEVVDPIGAGDSMVAGLTCGILRGMALEEVLALGVAAGAADVASFGAGLVTRDAVESLRSRVAVKPLRAA